MNRNDPRLAAMDGAVGRIAQLFHESLLKTTDTARGRIAPRVDAEYLAAVIKAWEALSSALKDETSNADEVVAGLAKDTPLAEHEQSIREIIRLLTVPRYIEQQAALVTFTEIRRLRRTWDNVLVQSEAPQAVKFTPLPPPESFIGARMTLTLATNPDGTMSVVDVTQED